MAPYKKLRCTLCIVKLACHCYIQSDTQFLQPHASNCDRRVSETTVEHPENLPALAHFLSDLSLSNINSKSFFKDMDKTDILHLNIISRHLEDVLQQEEINHISVKHVAEAIKRDLKVYIYATSKLLTNLGYCSNTIVAQSTQVISWVAMIMANIALMLTIYANCRVMTIIPGTYMALNCMLNNYTIILLLVDLYHLIYLTMTYINVYIHYQTL